MENHGGRISTGETKQLGEKPVTPHDFILWIFSEKK
jgi:hypothetical protein